jgi:hypothetical protein
MDILDIWMDLCTRYILRLMVGIRTWIKTYHLCNVLFQCMLKLLWVWVI